jgi:hypothetical protein
MASFNKVRVKKLYLPNAHATKKAFGSSSGLVTATADEVNALAGTGLTSTELGILNGATVTTNELNLLDGGWASFSTATTPASGSCAIQLVFKDAAGVAMANACVGTVYTATSAAGTTLATITSLAALTNGVVTIMDTGAAKYYKYITDATGKLGFTLTAAAASYYLIFEHPTKGIVVPSSVCVVNA